MEALTRMPFTAQKKIFKRLAELADSRCLSKEEQEKYDESRKVADYYSGLAGSYMAGEKTGIKKGIQKGITNEKVATVKRLFAMGLTPEQVAQGTELPLDEVLKLVQGN